MIEAIPDWIEALIALHGLAILVVNVTPTPKDNAIVAKVYKVLEWLAGVFPKAKE